MRTISFSSVLETDYHPDLQSLLFFNPHQERAKSGLIESLEKFGPPDIVVDGDFLHVKVGSPWDVQTLFAFDNHNNGQKPKLAGVIIYVRIDYENIVVVHVAVEEEYSVGGRCADKMLPMRFLVELREIARRIRGVRSITLGYVKGTRRMPVY